MMANRLLIIDDELEIGEFVARVAKLTGYETNVTTDPEMFRSLFVAWQPTHVVLDLMVPKVDGIEMLRFLAERDPEVRIIILSGAEAGILDAARRLGEARGLKTVQALAKPVRASELKNVLRDARLQASWLTTAELIRAIEEKELFLVFQPKIAIASRRIVGFEALARWQHPQRGLIAPAEFIAFAEEMEIIDRVTHAVIEAALAQLRVWRGQGIDVDIAVNISGKDLHDLTFGDRLVALCARHGVRSEQVTLELTETVVSRDAVAALDVLTRLRLRGFKLAIDDFGTGFSSLIQLQRLPFSEIKIDRAFIAECGANESSTMITKTVIELAHNLRMHAVAEGAESEAVLDVLARMQCDMAQGYCISRPMRADVVKTWASEWSMRKVG